MPTTLYFLFNHANSITMLYVVHYYKKKFKLTTYEFGKFVNSDFTTVQQFIKLRHSLQVAALQVGACKLMTVLVTHSKVRYRLSIRKHLSKRNYTLPYSHFDNTFETRGPMVL